MAASTRQRCTVTGCNPHLSDLSEADAHRERTGHRTAVWPVRSAEGKRREKKRNRTGYHRKYQLAREERKLEAFIAQTAEEDRVEAINAMTPKIRPQSQAADAAAFAAVREAHRAFIAGGFHEKYEHPFSSEGLGQ